MLTLYDKSSEIPEYIVSFAKIIPPKMYESIMTTWKPRPQDADGEIVCTERLGGLLKYYHRVRRAA